MNYRLFVLALGASVSLFSVSSFATESEELLSAVEGGRPVQAAQAAQSETLQNVLRETYLNNPTLRAARAELRAIHELVPQAYANFKPTIAAEGNITTADIDNDPAGSADGTTSKNLELSVSQPIYRGGRSFAELRGARNTVAAQEAVLNAAEQSVLLSAAAAYMDVLRDRAVLDLNINNRKVIQRQLEASRDRFDVGEVTRTDVSQSEARFADAQANVIRAQGNLQASLAIYEQVIGRMPPKKLERPTFSLNLPETEGSAIEYALDHNPDVVASVFIQKAAEDGVDEAFGELLPEVSLTGLWSKTYDPQPGSSDEQTTKSATVTASVPLYQAGDVRSRVRQAKETANQNYLEILEAKRLARQQTISNWQALQTAKAEIESRKAQVKAARIAQEGVRQEMRVGSRTVLDALDADQEFLDAEVALVTAQREGVVATFALASTLGLLTPDVLGFSQNRLDFGSHLDNVTRRIFSTYVESEK